MELTIEQALQQGVTAHKEGKLEEAERLYRAILQSQPTHPDANHNLGLIAVSVNKAGAALPLFKTALEANPKIEQFWLSYIDALIKEQQFDNAKQALEQAKKQGVDADRLNSLEAQLSPKRLKPNIAGVSPSQQQLGSLLEHYQNGRLSDAEKLATSISQEFPSNNFSWKILGAVFKATGRKSEAVDANLTAVALSPQDAKAHSNLGITLQELGRLDEALASFTRAIALKPDYVNAHSNLGDTLQELGRFDEALACYAQAIALKPDYVKAHSNLGITLQELGRLDEALASYTQAIALKPDYAEAYSNLGATLKKLGRLDESLASCAQAIALKPDIAEAHSNLGATLQELGRFDEALASFTQAIALKPDFLKAMLNISIAQSYMNNLEAEIVSLKNILRIDSDGYGLTAGVNLAICNFIKGDFTESKKLLLAATKIQEKTSSSYKTERIYWRYLSDILKWHENKYIASKKEKNDKTLYVLGESHSLTSHHLRIQYSGIDFFCSARLIKGCKQWHLGNAYRNHYKHQFESIFCALPKHSYVLLAIGEIDCRLKTGIIAYKKKFPEKQIKEIILTTIESYLTYIININFGCQHKVIIQGVPCPNIDGWNHSEKDIKQLVEVIKIFNCELKNKSKKKGFEFLDVYKLTDRGDGLSNNFWHIDSFHLSPDGMQKAWRRYASE
jgi:tetratricopeptide (TPR) repeat protein